MGWAAQGAREAVEEATEELSLLGSLQFVGNMTQRDELLAAALHHYVDGRKVEALQQFCEGLTIIGALDILKAHPTVLKSVFLQDQKPLLASEMVELFKTGRVSGPGSNRRLGPLAFGGTGCCKWRCSPWDKA
ncbi:hypothetical protein KUCAC02_026329 [Chaenocephalus aceratus]|uniref:Uncharacterized protein n=1 Tax=Chaenocephalus aceratus TaxID=36190 RepID=A0ACB9VWP9_CHAAC|nr:hypothetical protein KUCAC02_026329 [Chaenocephalus aceratus]